MADFERGLIHERVMAGLAVARSRGRSGGRAKVRQDRDKDAAKFRQMHEDGESLR